MNIGVIGGADGPTAIFVSSGTSPYPILAIIAVIAVIAAVVIIRRIKKRKR